jgi:hypothetical protein
VAFASDREVFDAKLCVERLLADGSAEILVKARDEYPTAYDDVLREVHGRLVQHGYATKMDLAALIAWKHVHNAQWMEHILRLPEEAVQTATASAFAPGIGDQERIAELQNLKELPPIRAALLGL